MFWDCPSLDGFNTFSEINSKQIEPEAIIALFGFSPTALHLTKINKDVITFVTLLMRPQIMLRWKSPAPPSHALWMKGFLNCIKLEKNQTYTKGVYFFLLMLTD